MRALVIAACSAGTLALALTACSSPPRRTRPGPRPEPPDAGAPAPAEEPPRLEIPEDRRAPEGGAPCMRSADCATGQQCRGAPGCTSQWACGEPRTCLPDVVAYCGCDQQTFYAAGGCPGRPYAHLGPCDDIGEPIAAGTELGMPAWDEPLVADPRRCTSSADCARNRICWGVPGCATDWSCVRVRGCTRDSVPYCGCDGETFYASSTCPGRPYLHRGGCREAYASATAAPSPPDAEAGRSADARRPGAVAPASTRRDRSLPALGATGGAATAGSATVGSGTFDAAARLPPGACRTQRDCRRGEVCQGPPGCGMEAEWRCAPPERECVRDTQVFCGCDGRDFRASMFCPGRPYRHRGSCEIDRLLELSGSVVR
jgi:hypothetical protein